MIFFNKSKKFTYSDFSEIGTDMHSHLVPGVDDGASDLENSIALIDALQDLGFKKLITTPHTLENIHHNTKASLEQGFAPLTNNSNGVPIYLASEYFLDNHFKAQLAAESIL